MTDTTSSLNHQPQLFGSTIQRFNVFFAVLPPAAVSERILELTRNVQRHYGLSIASRISHVSLLPLGICEEIPGRLTDAANRLASGIRVQPFEAIFDGIQAFRGPSRPLVLRCGKGLHGFVALRKALAATFAKSNRLAPSAFIPHLTLFYGGDGIEETPLDRPISWQVDEFSLTVSRLGRRRYEVRGAWPLRP